MRQFAVRQFQVRQFSVRQFALKKASAGGGSGVPVEWITARGGRARLRDLRSEEEEASLVLAMLTEDLEE